MAFQAGKSLSKTFLTVSQPWNLISGETTPDYKLLFISAVFIKRRQILKLLKLKGMLKHDKHSRLSANMLYRK